VDDDPTVLHPRIARLNVKVSNQLQGKAPDIGIERCFRNQMAIPQSIGRQDIAGDHRPPLVWRWRVIH